MNEKIYTIYKMTKQLIEKTESCCEKDHSEEELFKEWKNSIVIFDTIDEGYAERYKKEKENESSS